MPHRFHPIGDIKEIFQVCDGSKDWIIPDNNKGRRRSAPDIKHIFDIVT